MTVVELEAHFHLTSCVGLLRIELGSDDVVAHESLGSGNEINITVETTHVEGVLSFEIRGICPTDHLHRYLVFTSFHRLGDVKLCIVVAAFGVADVLAIDPNVSTTIDAIEVEEDILLVPVGREVEGAAIAAHRVGVYQSFILIAELDEGWFVVEDVVHIDINGLVVALHFPARGHFDVVPLRHIKCGLHKRCVALGSIWSILELPLSIECEELRLLRIQPGFFVACIDLELSGGGVGDEGGAAALLVDAKNHFIFPLCTVRTLDVLESSFGEFEEGVVAFLRIEHHLTICGDGKIFRFTLERGCTKAEVGAFFFDNELLVGVAHIERPQERSFRGLNGKVYSEIGLWIVECKSV